MEQIVRQEKDAFREKRSKEMRSRYASGWECVAGRCKKFKFEGKNGYVCHVDGTWEFEFAKALDASTHDWVRNTRRFSYTNEHGTQSTYTPDFYIKDLNVYVEIKGYETEKDRCKWRDFPEKLIIIKKKQYILLNEVPLERVLLLGERINFNSEE